MLSRLPTQELFILDNDNDFPLNLPVIEDNQLSDKHLATALRKDPLKYKKNVRENMEHFVHPDAEAIYVPEPLRASILQWYHTTLQHPIIKRMQVTLKENFYWPGVDTAVEALVHSCNLCQKCKLTVVKNMAKFPCQSTKPSRLGKKFLSI